MTEDLRMKVSDYRTAILIFQKMLEEGIINEDEYSEIDTIIAENIGLNSDTIFRWKYCTFDVFRVNIRHLF